MKENWLKRHWTIIYLIPLICGLLTIILSFIFNPAFVERTISSDGHLTGQTTRNIYILEVLTFVIGLLLIFLSRAIRGHSERKEKIVINFLMLCGSTIFTLMLLEIALKVVNYIKPFNRQRHVFFQHDDVLGWTHKPNTTASFKNVPLHINARGLRDDDIPYQKPDGEFRILFLGDSQLFGDGIRAEETFVSVLESELHSVQAINAGVIGYGTDQQLLFLKREGIKYSPDLIIVALNAYDLPDNISETIQSGYSKPIFKIEGNELRLTNVPVPKFDIVERMSRSLKRISYLYYFASRFGSRFYRGIGLESIGTRGQQGEEGREPFTAFEGRLRGSGEQSLTQSVEGSGYDPHSILLQANELEGAVAVTLRILKEIAAVGRDVSARTVVVFLPYEMDFGADFRYKHHIDQICGRFKTYSEGNNFFFLDIRSDIATMYHPNFYRDTMHFSAEGSEVVAEILKKYLISLNFIESSRGKLRH